MRARRRPIRRRAAPPGERQRDERGCYGDIEITRDKSGKLLNIDFKGHNKLKATLEYMDRDEWLLTYNNIAYGMFPVTFKNSNETVGSIELRVNDFLDYDSYNFVKMSR